MDLTQIILFENFCKSKNNPRYRVANRLDWASVIAQGKFETYFVNKTTGMNEKRWHEDEGEEGDGGRRPSAPE